MLVHHLFLRDTVGMHFQIFRLYSGDTGLPDNGFKVKTGWETDKSKGSLVREMKGAVR